LIEEEDDDDDGGGNNNNNNSINYENRLRRRKSLTPILKNVYPEIIIIISFSILHTP
jgi:hypothetical protein